MVHSGLVAPLGHESLTCAYPRVPMHPVDPPDAWRGDPMRLFALISHCGSLHIHRRETSTSIHLDFLNPKADATRIRELSSRLSRA